MPLNIRLLSTSLVEDFDSALLSCPLDLVAKLPSNIYAVILRSAAFTAVLMSSSDKVLSNDTDPSTSGD